MNTLLLSGLIVAVLRAATPVLLATMGSVLTERAGMSNIGVEGMMLGGAFASVVVVLETGNSYIGLAVGCGTGLLLSLLMSFVVIDLKGDIIFVGFAINLFVSGFTVLLMSELYGSKGSIVLFQVRKIPEIKIPFNDFAVLDAFSSLNLMVYFGFGLVIVTWFIIFKSRFGLRVRAIGEDSEAATAAGLPVRQIRYQAMFFGGATAGLGGAVLSLVNVGSFTRDMTAGRGFIALAAALFGRRHPVAALGAVLVFGMAEAGGNRLQGQGIPPQFVQMLPYLSTFIALAFISVRSSRTIRRRILGLN